MTIPAQSNVGVVRAPDRSWRRTAAAPSMRLGGSSSARYLPTGWPLFALFGGYPLWWLLGISEFACLLFAIPMGLHLARQGGVRAPKGIGVWLLFLFWVLGGAFVLQVHAPGTIPGASSTRYVTFTYRVLWYIAATVVMLYVLNTRRTLSNFRIASALSNMFVVVTLGGVLGVLAPHLSFRSGLEYVLPGALRNYGFVHTLIHPVTAQVQHFLGYDEARPSAPFAFTNEWGLVVACFLPFFVLTWCSRDAGWRRVAAAPILLLATLSVVYSLNRGLWLALGGAGVFVAVRYALVGRVKILGLLGAAVSLLVAVVIFTPLGDLVVQRLAHPDSNQGRANLGSLTISSVLNGSPIMGFGTTRNVLGNFTSIAAGASASCPGCSPPPLGTQGHLWLVLFSQGLVGLVLYLGFFAVQLIRHLRIESPYVIAALTVIIVHFITMPVYDSIGPALFAIMVSVGILGRAEADREMFPQADGSSDHSTRQLHGRPLAPYFQFARIQVAALLVVGVLGALVGGIYEASKTTEHEATQSILVPDDSATTRRAPPTIDTEAQLVTSDAVLAALQRVQPGVSRIDLARRLSVSASPNTRILHVTYTAASAQAAVAGIRVVTSEYVRVLARSEGGAITPVNHPRVVQNPTLHHSLDGWIVSVSTGALGALALGLGLVGPIGSRRARIRSRSGMSTVCGLPVVAEFPASPSGGLVDDDRAPALRLLSQLAVSSVLATPASPGARRVAASLDRALWPSTCVKGGGALIVMSSRSSEEDVRELHSSVSQWSEHIAGVLVVVEG